MPPPAKIVTVRGKGITKTKLQADVKTIKRVVVAGQGKGPGLAVKAKPSAAVSLPKPVHAKLVFTMKKVVAKVQAYGHVKSKVDCGLKQKNIWGRKPNLSNGNGRFYGESRVGVLGSERWGETLQASPVVSLFEQESVIKDAKITTLKKERLKRSVGRIEGTGIKEPRDDITVATCWEGDWIQKSPHPCKRKRDFFESSPIETSDAPEYRPGSQIHILFRPKTLATADDSGTAATDTDCVEQIDLLQPLEEGDSSKQLDIEFHTSQDQCGKKTLLTSKTGGLEHSTDLMVAHRGECRSDQKSMDKLPERDKIHSLRNRLENIKTRANQINELVNCLGKVD